MLPSVKMLFKNGKNLHGISDALEEAVYQAKQLAELRQRYEHEIRDTGVGASVDPRMMALYTDVTDLVGIEETRDKLISMLTDGDDWEMHPLKTISIVGFGGLGKTTLAKAAYDKIKVQFECCAFLSVSQNPEMKKVLKDILYGLDKSKYANIHNGAMDEKHLIDDIIEYLNDKRYLIVIDDIWSGDAWELIQCAFSKKSPGSRVITTTRNVSVSEACCSSGDDIYKMEPLSDDVSRTLFCKRVFSHEEGCPQELLQVSEDILKKCGGIPLAIITTASILANKHHRKDQWYALLSSIGHGLTEDHSLEQMKKILLFSYYDLPSYLKPCLLYLSIFPEDHEITKSRLIWRWISEGLVYSEEQETNLYELGERYFNELVNRSLIQPIGFDEEYEEEACRVHDMVLELICSLSSEENFVTILDGTRRRMPNSESKVRRLSIQNSKIDVDTSRMEHVRSVTICTSNVAGKVLDISCFRVLRVLDLEGCDISDIGYVENLIHLRYLGLKDTNVEHLPVGIGRLQFLITMDLKYTHIQVLPSSVAQLRRLMCLYVDRGTKLPCGIGNLTSLEVLDDMGVSDEDLDVVKGLGHLTNLRVLCMYYSGSDESVDKALVESLGNLCKLESLNIYSKNSAAVNFMSEGWLPPAQLRRLSMPWKGGWFKTVPSWINPSSLSLLSYLRINVEEVRPQDIRVLGMMPALCYLKLKRGLESSRRDVDVEVPVLSSGAFPCLIECLFSHYGVLPSTFPQGAASRLKRLKFVFPAKWISREDFDLSMCHLPSLERLKCTVDQNEASDAELGKAEAAMELAGQDHPNHPLCTVETWRS
ncbi:unnamed protein product [Alopecurus aequalis]